MKLWSRFVALFRREKLDAEMAEELRLHLEQRMRENLARGMAPDEAHSAALRRFGGVEQVKEIAREQRSWRGLDDVARDLGHTARVLRRNRGLSAATVLTLALGIGAAVTVFTIVRGVLIKPLPFPDSNRVVVTLNQYPRTNFGRVGASVPNYFERRQGIPAFAEVAAVRFMPVNVGLGDSPARVSAAYVTSSFFPLLGVSPALGQFFSEPETDAVSRHELVLSDAFWRRHFNANPAVVGQVLRVQGVVATIVGVLPPGFHYPSADAQLWLRLTFTAQERAAAKRHATSLDVIARLGRDASVADAQNQLDALNGQLAADDPQQVWAADAGFRAVVVTLQADVVAPVRPALVLLQLGAGFLLLISAVNFVNLLLGRAIARAKEFAVRRALGASQGRVAAQLCLETFCLTLVGGAVGLGGGAAAVRVISIFGGNRLPLAHYIRLDAPVVMAAIATTIVIGVAATLAVIGCASSRSLSVGLSAESRSSRGNRFVRRLRHGLIIVQVALAFVLVAITSFLGDSLRRVLSVQPGFKPDSVLTGVFFLPSTRYQTPAKRLAFTERLWAELRDRGEFKASGISTSLPFASIGGLAFTVDGNPIMNPDTSSTHYVSLLGGQFFETLGVPLREGRYFTAADSHRPERVCVVDEDFAQSYWPGRSPLGHHVFEGTSRDPSDRGATIVGVVGTVREGDPRARPIKGKVYFPLTEEWAPPFLYVSLRSEQAPESMASGMRAALAKIDPELPLFDVQPLRARLDESLTERRIPLRVAGAFAGVSLLLALIGVHGVVAHDVAQRRREIGIRMALGASPRRIVILFLSLGGRLWLVGLLVGVGATLGAGRTMASLLYGVSPQSGEILLITALVLGAGVALASGWPSFQAARISPSVALRCE